MDTIFSCLLTLLLTCVHSLIIEYENIELKHSKKSEFIQFTVTQNVFGFQKNGSVHVDLVCEEPLSKVDSAEVYTQHLFLCRKEVQSADDVPSMTSHCVDMRNYREEISDTELSWRYRVESAQFYRIILYDETPTNDVLHCDIKAWLMNPENNHLSSDQLLIPTTYTIATFVWVFFLAVWFLNFAIFTRFSNKLHKVLTIVLILKLANIVVSLLYWKTFHGRGYIDSQLRAPFLLSSSLLKGGIFMFLMLAAEGYCIIWEQAKLLKYYMILDGSFFIMELCYKFIHKYFQGFAIVFASMMIYIAFKCSTMTVSTIRKNITGSTNFVNNHKLSYHSEKSLLDRLNKQYLVMNCVQGLIIGLPCILIVVESMTAFLLLYEEWARVLIYEIVQLALLVYCAAVFRLRDFSKFTNISIRTPFTRVTVLGTPYRGILYISQPEDHEEESGEV